MSHLSTTDELLLLFGDMKSEGYTDPIPLSDTKIGFSVRKNYPEDIKYKPAKNKAGVADNLAVIWIVYNENSANKRTGLIPLRIRISMMSLYRALHWDYDFEDDNCPTKESVLESAKTTKPMELTLNDEFVYDTHTKGFLDSNNQSVSGLEILNRIFSDHCNSTHPIKGIRLKSDAIAKKFIRNAFDKTINSIIFALEKIFGRTLDERFDRSVFLDGYLYENFKKVSVDSIEIAGYRASKKVILMFCVVIVFLCYSILPTENNTYASELLHSDALMFIHFILILYILDELIPNTLFWITNKLILYRKIYFNYLIKKSIL